ncbi:hypothetical protein BH09BAC4_BH09BAC4_26950 [soil metagenome]
MKTNLLASLLLCSALSMQAQDFRTLPPAEQPNATELAYFGSNNPNRSVTTASDSGDIDLVLGFLNDLSSNQLEAAHRRLAEGFVTYGPGYNDKLETDNLLNQWERIGKLFTDQNLTIETTSTTVVPNGENQGKWVYVKGVWSARSKALSGKSIRMPFHQLVKITDGLIERICISYGADQLFYDLGFSLYAGPSSAALHR